MAALVLDTADGRIARITNTESEFGAQFDSLSDMAAFGVAPALLVFSYSLSDLGRLGWIATFIYMACAALRLARFNTESDLKSFTGLASPAAAVILASVVWVLVESYPNASATPAMPYAIAAITVVVGLLMVSPIRYFSPKAIDFNRRVQFLTLVAVGLVFAIIVAEPPRHSLARWRQQYVGCAVEKQSLKTLMSTLMTKMFSNSLDPRACRP